MVDVKLFEVLHDYENGKFKNGDMLLYQNNPQMTAMFKSGNFVWTDNYVAVDCKDFSKDIWYIRERQ
ncbi:hypothetical protein COM21_00280 [Bacillus toyonensis]|uniref:Phage protein n=1 Tax=Bacillus toyonensis TaxID=155322 RepID=A0ABX6GFS2_9BACI|nr:hypothetical protein [Bacillus toyonensis]KNH40872.1 hypothetical protein ACS75_09450 [Bacillus thuringiensis]MED2710497.1 hypothetical protein [Bacillus toyonensis]MED2738158.1 hypothetical protein [Bacillus toyonensis]PDY89756.1 hypothetical protein CON67_14980 [Bacillus toyonensis]PDZ29410.1 hypothetical protein CON85_06070 [Bacillus toyonensis]